MFSRNTPSGAPDHIVSDVLPKLIRCFGSFNIIHLHKGGGGSASVDQPPACSQEPTSINKSQKKKKKIHEALYKVAPAEHPIKCVSGQSFSHKKHMVSRPTEKVITRRRTLMLRAD